MWCSPVKRGYDSAAVRCQKDAVRAETSVREGSEYDDCCSVGSAAMRCGLSLSLSLSLSGRTRCRCLLAWLCLTEREREGGRGRERGERSLAADVRSKQRQHHCSSLPSLPQPGRNTITDPFLFYIGGKIRELHANFCHQRWSGAA